MFLICYVISKDYLFKAMGYFFGWKPLTVVAHQLAKFNGQRSFYSRDVMDVIFHLIFQDHVIKRFPDFIKSTLMQMWKFTFMI